MENTKSDNSGKNIPSHLLSPEENEKIFTFLGRRCSTLATGVVQLFVTELPHHSQWHKKCCGVVCFVKDGIRKSYYIRVFDVDKGALVWEQELYHQFQYKVPKPFFHTFEADECMAGLNFADNREASDFENAVQLKLRARNAKKLERRKAQQMSAIPSNAGVIASSKGKSESMPSLTVANEKPGRVQKRKKLTKADIGTPMDFQHVQHVGFHPETGFDIRHLDSDLKDFFSIVGVSDKDLKDNETRNFIYDFIDKNGGVERAKEEVSNLTSGPQPPPLPAREVPQTPHVPRTAPGARTAAPPPPPSIPPVAAQQSLPMNSANRNICVPPPPPARVPPPPKPVPKSLGPPSTTIPPPPPPPPPAAVPLPPPPPPPMNISSEGPPPPPPMPAFLSNGSGSSDVRSALMEQIRKGKELHPVEINGDSSVPNSSGDARGALLNQIRQGVELKRVPGESKSLPPAAPMQGLAGALARALLERNRAIHLTDESESGDEDDDDEWDD